MKLKLQRVATFIEKFGFIKGLQLYSGLRSNKLSEISLPFLKNPIYLRPGTTDNAIFDQVFVQDEYAMEFSFKPEVIVDGGAHIGLFTISMKNRYPEVRIICVEPGRSNYNQLQKNTGTYHGIETLHAAIWNKPGRVLMQEQHQLGHSGLRASENKEGDSEAISMDMIFEKFALCYIDILKLDIETAEKIIFANGYQDWLPRVRLIIIELHDWLEPGCSRVFFEAVHQTFRNYNYSVCGENTIIENLDFGK